MPLAAISASASGANAVVAAPGAGYFIRVIGFTLSANAAVNAKWQSASTDKTGLYYMGDKGGVVRSDPEYLFDCAVNEALNLNLSGNVAVGGDVRYTYVRTSLS